VRVEASRRLLVLRLSAFGDIIHTIPAVAAIRKSRPDYAIGWVVEAAYRELIETIAPVDRVFPVRMRQWRKTILSRRTRKEIGDLRRDIREFSSGGTSIDFQGLVKSAALGVISGSRERYGFGHGSIRERGALLFTNRRIEIDRTRHVIEWNQKLAASLGARPVDPLSIDYLRFAMDRTGRLGELLRTHRVVICPSAGASRKVWNLERYGELAGRLAQDCGLRSLVVWGPGEESLAHAIGEMTRSVTVAPPTDLRELAFLVSGADVVVGGDTGPVHLAAALRTPVVGLYGPTDPERNGPWGQIDRCVETFSSSRSMDEIEVPVVLKRVVEVLTGGGVAC
jgi:heptosyltransferase I